jgi:hypothetical protein
MGLGRHLATGASADHAAAEAWMGSPNGKEFMTQSGESWRAAHVASGADPTSAQERSSQETIVKYYLLGKSGLCVSELALDAMSVGTEPFAPHTRGRKRWFRLADHIGA